MKKFEYLKTKDLTENQLNELGKIGWELISYTCLSKRIIPDVYKDLHFRDFEFIYIFKKESNENNT